MDIEKLDDELYRLKYIEKSPQDLWSKIKDLPLILREAVKIKKDKYGQKDTVKGLCISECILLDYENVDKEAYNELMKYIYSNTDIARTVLNGALNGGYSFLLMSLWNHNFILTEQQKKFAVDEAMNKIGTTSSQKRRLEFEQNLEKKNTDTTYALYVRDIFENMSYTQAHGVGCYDIRYQILKNPNWSLEEKKNLIKDFWYDDQEYADTVAEWEAVIMAELGNYVEIPLNVDQYDIIHDYTHEDFLRLTKNDARCEYIYLEIQFLREISTLRPIYEKSEKILN